MSAGCSLLGQAGCSPSHAMMRLMSRARCMAWPVASAGAFARVK